MRKTHVYFFVTFLLILCFLVENSSAQRPGQGFRSQTIMLGGSMVRCSSNGQPVIWMADYTLNDAGHTMPNFLLIAYNPNILDTFPDDLKLFAMGHECGHAFNRTANENEADCWSITTGVRQGWFSEANFNDLVALFGNNPGDLHHPPGPARIANMRQCLNAALHHPDSGGGGSTAHTERRERFEPDDAASNCVRTAASETSVQWHPTNDDPTVHYRFGYRNTCDQAVKCSITIAVGNRPRSADSDDFDDWTETDRNTAMLSVPGNDRKAVSGTLTWDVNKPRSKMPAIRRSSQNDDDDDWKMKCVFNR